MSTANRPTFHQALGSHNSSNRAVPTALRRVRDLPGEGTLKLRETRDAPRDTIYPQDADLVSIASSSSGGGSESEDEDAELMRELARIRGERARQEEQKVVEGNPLIGLAGVARRWDDDTVFKRQAGKAPRPGEKRFINDAVRSDFHRRFLNKYIA